VEEEMADTKIDDTRRKPIVEDDEPDDWFDVPHPKLFSSSLTPAA
jgi:hypothetical protein